MVILVSLPDAGHVMTAWGYDGFLKKCSVCQEGAFGNDKDFIMLQCFQLSYSLNIVSFPLRNLHSMTLKNSLTMLTQSII